MKITDEQEASRTNKLVSAAKAMISGQVGVTVGSMTIKNKLIWLGTDWEERYPIFNEYFKELPLDIPIGSERLNWNLEKLLELDPQLAKLEYEYRAKLFKSCADIIEQHG